MTDPAPTPIYPSSGEGATPLLAAHLRDRIREEGPLSFASFMAEALYHPDWGYYSDPGRQRVGRSGDFITSVSVGPTMGRLLAHRLESFWRANRSPAAFHLIEPGPESGDLAFDILAAARSIDPDFHAAIHYHALEPQAGKRMALAKRVEASGESRLQVHPSSDDLSVPFGAVLANEVIDALPVHLIEWDRNRWRERRVGHGKDGFEWTAVDVETEELKGALPALTPEAGTYLTEVCLAVPGFLAPLAKALKSGLFLFIDYGHSEAEYYAPSRREGTLQSYHRQKATNDPLRAPGSQDLTAHANFSRLVATGRALGLAPSGFCRQERYLTALADPLFAPLTPDSPGFEAAVRQFRTLTHPSLLGGSFHMLELLKGEPVPDPDPFRFDPRGLEAL